MKLNTIFFDASGPMVTYAGGTLNVSDLNPEIHTRWRMTRFEMFKFGMRSIVAAIFAR